MTIWVLVFFLTNGQSGGPAVIDNIATLDECVRIQKLVYEVRPNYGPSGRCIEVRKVKP